MNQWVVYLDESGRFEGGAAAAERPVVAGVMIPVGVDEAALEAEVVRILRGHDALHRRGAETGTRRTALYKELFPALARRGVEFCYIRYGQDVLAAPQFAADALGGNRYLSMVTRLLENLLFGNAWNLREADAYAVQAASRLFPVPPGDCGAREILAQLGFEQDDDRRDEQGNLLYRLVRDGYLLGALRQAALEAVGAPRANELGSLHVVAVTVGGPFHQLADFLSNLLGQFLPADDLAPFAGRSAPGLGDARNLKELAAAAARHARHRFVYGPLDDLYRGLFRRLRHGDAAGIIADWSAVEALAAHPYYAEPTRRLLEAATDRLLKEPAEAQLELIESAARRYLLRRSGYEETARRILERLAAPLERLWTDNPQEPGLAALRFRVQRDLLACANHQGRLDRAADAMAAGEAMRETVCRTPEGAALYLDFLNHRSVYHANMFQFREAQHLLEGCIRLRESEMGALERFFGVRPGRDQLLGELYGSLGQALAFQAPLDAAGEQFSRAEACFNRAVELFERKGEERVERNFLAHLYLDQGRLGEAAELAAGLAGTDVRWPEPVRAAAERGDPYTLALCWKAAWELRRQSRLAPDEVRELDRLALELSLEAALGDRAAEHPAEFCAFYQALHAAETQPEAGETLLQGISLVQPEAASVTLEWIRAAMVARWILHAAEKGRATPEFHHEEVRGRIRRALEAAPELRTQWRESQLGETPERLLGAPPGPLPRPGLAAFAARFTFNYR
ncbi:MAG TPA: hypothetical protein PK017_08415 [Acidobacteriota bacterium]|nr:hypothetical protein [Acidobacteriota bacterium]